jgi:DNA replication licensing factor MCM7
VQNGPDADPENDAANANGAADNSDFPPALTRRYECRILPLTSSENKPVALRAVKAAHIGRLVRIRAMVTRVSDVKPLVSVVTYTCDTCGVEVRLMPLNNLSTQCS